MPGQDEIARAVPVLEQLVVAERAAAAGRRGSSRPRSTLTSCGSSSSESRRRTRPTRVTRGSSRILKSAPRRLVRLLELPLLLGGVGHHRAELQHPELALADPDAPVDVEHRPARVELDRERDRGARAAARRRRRSALRRRCRRPASAAQSQPVRIGGRSSKSGTPCARHVLALVHEQVGRVRGEADTHAAAVRPLDDVEHRALVEVGLASGSARPVAVARGSPASSSSEEPSIGRPGPPSGRPRRRARRRCRRDTPHELALQAVRGSPPRRRARPAGGSPSTLHQLERDRLVRRPEQADRERARDDGGRDQPGRREVVARADAEREHDQGDEHERRDDAPRRRGGALASA